MALSRWSHSPFYIYEVDDDVLQICLFGYYSCNDILINYSKIDNKAKSEGYNLLDRLELMLYLKSWARFYIGKTERQTYIKQLNFLRTAGWVRTYLRNPYGSDFSGDLLNYFPFFYYGLRISKKEREANSKKLYEEWKKNRGKK